jgi:hypothetical protein
MNNIYSKFTLGIFIIFAPVLSFASNSSVIPTQTTGWTATDKFLTKLQANINWLIAMGIILSLCMTVIHIFFNHNENIMKAIAKTIAGLLGMKIGAYLIALAIGIIH